MIDIKKKSGYRISAGIIPDFSTGNINAIVPKRTLIKQTESVIRNLDKFLSLNSGAVLDQIAIYIYKYELAGLVVDMLRRSGFGPYIGKCSVVRRKSGVLVSLEVEIHFDPLARAKI